MTKLPIFILILLLSRSALALTFEKYTERPKLVVVMVIDQFRADYLSRFQKEFLTPGARGEVGGFNYLMKNGAYFPLAQYDVLENMTCPGHAMISTGSHPRMNGIIMNEWYDSSSGKEIYCVEDEKFGVSPRNLKTTTFADELKNSGASSKVVSVALKDRAAILLGGHRADLALWMDIKNFRWTTNAYYMKDTPAWVQSANEILQKSGKFKKDNSRENKKALSGEYGVQVTREIAEAALRNEKLGQGSNTDILTISFSSHDMTGHMYGPNSPEIKAVTLAEDKEISKLLTTIKKQLGSLSRVVFALTADHGVAPTIDYAQNAKLDAGRLDYLVLYKKVYERLDQKFGKPKKEWFAASMNLNFYFSPEALKERKATAEAVEAEAKSAMLEVPGVLDVVTKSEIQKGMFPYGEVGQQTLRQYIAGINGDLILIPRPFYYEKDENTTTHVTGYSYDRTVPLIIAGPHVKAAVHAGEAKVIDLAPTLSFMMGVLPPATTAGKPLKEIFE
jgi:predicted AlkP superfamily pyrophosphatase or phosphodiesterase